MPNRPYLVGKDLVEVYHSMTDLGLLNYFLGVSVTRNTSGMFLSQRKYATEVLERAGMLICNPCCTPVDMDSKLAAAGDLISDLTLYRRLVGALQYLTFTRPALSRSSAEAEYRGVANAVAETCWLRNLLRELHTPLSTVTIVYCDNVSAEVTRPGPLFRCDPIWGCYRLVSRAKVIENQVKYSEHSTVTYTSVSFPVEDDSDIGSPGVDGPPIMPEDPYAYIMAAYQVPPSPDYIPGPEVPPSPDYIPGPEVPPSPDYIPGPEPMYPEYIPQEDEILPAEEQPLPAAASPTADSPGYVPESDPEEEPEEDDEDPEEDPADYPADRNDDEDDDKDKDEEEKEEHPAPADSVPPREEVERLLALTTSPPSPLTPLSSPLPQIPSSPLPIPSPPPNSPTHIEILKSCLPLRKRVRFASPTPSHEVEESSVAGAAKQDRPAIARDDPYSIVREDLYGFVDMVDVPPRCSTSRELDY
ncbi:putative reverse transcriptase domain-containing protein, partial [Tanacetum coccineum]